MKNNSKKFTILVGVLVALIAFAALIIHNYKTKTSFKYAAENAAESSSEKNPQDKVESSVTAAAAALEESRKNSELLKILPSDFVVGDKNAPVLVIEYASLSCPHCASFARESFEKLKTDFIDSGKVKFVYRNFPLNQPALVAAMFAMCKVEDAKSSDAAYYDAVKILFRTQDSWAFDEKYSEKLEAIAKLDGMSSERFTSCITSKALQEKILVARMNAAKTLQIKSTPSFFVNGEISEGYVDYQTIKKLVEKKLTEIKK